MEIPDIQKVKGMLNSKPYLRFYDSSDCTTFDIRLYREDLRELATVVIVSSVKQKDEQITFMTFKDYELSYQRNQPPLSIETKFLEAVRKHLDNEKVTPCF